jgi:hypothetical protein
MNATSAVARVVQALMLNRVRALGLDQSGLSAA